MSLSEDLRRLADCKTNIKSAIEEKGVQVTSDLFEVYPLFISMIEGGSPEPEPEPDWDEGMLEQLVNDLSEMSGVLPAYTFRRRDFFGANELQLNVSRIGKGAFQECKNIVKVTGGVEQVGDEAFQNVWANSPYMEIEFPNCNSVGIRAFANIMALTKVTLKTDESVQVSMEDNLFGGCENLQEVHMKWGGEIPMNTFTLCRSLGYIGDTTDVRWIGSSAFMDCVDMRQYHFPSCEFLQDGVFNHNTNLEVISFVGVSQVVQFENEGWLFSSGGDDPDDPTEYSIVVPDDLYDDWVADEKWAKYADHIVKESEFEG